MKRRDETNQVDEGGGLLVVGAEGNGAGARAAGGRPRPAAAGRRGVAGLRDQRGVHFGWEGSGGGADLTRLDLSSGWSYSWFGLNCWWARHRRSRLRECHSIWWELRECLQAGFGRWVGLDKLKATGEIKMGGQRQFIRRNFKIYIFFT